jgi:hypothetical protein
LRLRGRGGLFLGVGDKLCSGERGECRCVGCRGERFGGLGAGRKGRVRGGGRGACRGCGGSLLLGDILFFVRNGG